MLKTPSLITPRQPSGASHADAEPEELAAAIDETDEERFPVRRGHDDVAGYVTTRDLARLLSRSVRGGIDAILRPVYAVPPTARALDVLEQLQSKRIAIAVIVDEAGGVEGIADIDDLAEEVVGTLLVGKTHDDATLHAESDGSWVLPATTRVHVANRRLDLELPMSPRWSTLGGLVNARLGTVPSVGARVVLEDGTVIEVVEASAKSVHRVRVRAPAPSTAQ